MDFDIVALLQTMTLRPPSSQQQFASFLDFARGIPHDDYVEFLRRHNGCDGPIGAEGHLRLWSIDSMMSRHDELQTDVFAPGLLLFGGDGGNEAFAFDRTRSQWPIVSVPLVGMSRKEMKPLASTFTEFIKSLAAGDV